MSNISVLPDEMNIACTIVLLQRIVHAGIVPEPLAVQLAMGASAGWRAAAIEHLTNCAKPHLNLSPAKKTDWDEVNEELDFYERRDAGKSGRTYFLP